MEDKMNVWKKLFGPVDMTTGSPIEKLVVFAIPMLLGNIAQQLYNTVDSIVVGQYIGDDALAAVGSAGPILNLLIVLFVGISMGTGIKVSQYVGAKDREALSETIGNCMVITGIATIVIMIVASLIARPLLVLLNTPDSIIDWCASFLQIMFFCCAGMSYFNILSGVLRGLGDSISALLYLLVSTGLNIVLDLLFVVVFHWGVNGVAIATSIAQVVSAILCIWKLSRMKEYFDFKIRYFKLNKKAATDIIRLGLPTGITQAMISVAMITVQSLTNSFGEMFIAANVIVQRVDGFAMLPNFSFGMALTTYAGQNVGAKRYDRVEKGAKQGTFLALGTSATITALILIFGKDLMGIFTNTPDLVNLSMRMMRILALGYLAMAVSQSLSGIMRGAGDTMTPMWITITTTIVLRVPLAYLMTYLTRSPEHPHGLEECLFLSLLISWIIGVIITYAFYKKGKWRKMALNQ
jgi:putative MATE family efflux protein